MKKIVWLLLILLAVATAFLWKRGGPDKPAATLDQQVTYTDPDGRFTFEYPRAWIVSGQDGPVLAKVTAPRSYFPQTNFSEAILTVGWQGGATDETCQGTATSTEAAAGNLYEATTHKKIFDGDCYTFERIIHSTNIGNYPPEQGIKEFDKERLVRELEAVVESFRYLVNSD